MRVLVRSTPLIRKLGRWFLTGVRTKTYPDSSLTFCFDGYRNVGFLSRDLAEVDAPARQLLRERFADWKPNCVWDIGANIGFYSMFFSTLRPEVKTIRCYEPDPLNVALLRTNCERNRLNWIVRPVGLSDRAATATFYADPETGATGSVHDKWDFIGHHYGATRKEIPVELSTIDREVEQGADIPEFLKIDVEGHELHVLRGGQETLRRYRPPMMLEAAWHQEELTKLLVDYGYDLWDERGNRIDCAQFTTLALPH